MGHAYVELIGIQSRSNGDKATLPGRLTDSADQLSSYSLH